MKIQINRNEQYLQTERRLNLVHHSSDTFTSEQGKDLIRKTVFSNRILVNQLSKLDKLEELLVQRQHVYCSYFRPKTVRLQLDQQILELLNTRGFTAEEKAQVQMVLDQDQVCGSSLSYIWSRDQRNNGRRMWTVLKELREAKQGNTWLEL